MYFGVQEAGKGNRPTGGLPYQLRQSASSRCAGLRPCPLQIVRKDCDKFLGRQWPGIWVAGNMAKMLAVILHPVSIK